jgi:hypothetical protein
MKSLILILSVFITVFVAGRISYCATTSSVIASSVKIGGSVDYVGVIDNYAYVLSNDLGFGLFLNLHSVIVPNPPYEERRCSRRTGRGRCGRFYRRVAMMII